MKWCECRANLSIVFKRDKWSTRADTVTLADITIRNLCEN